MDFQYRSPKFIWAPCAQLYSLAETPNPPLVSQDRRHLFVARCLVSMQNQFNGIPRETTPETTETKVNGDSKSTNETRPSLADSLASSCQQSQLGELYCVQLSGCSLQLIQVSSSTDLVLYSPLAVHFSQYKNKSQVELTWCAVQSSGCTLKLIQEEVSSKADLMSCTVLWLYPEANTRASLKKSRPGMLYSPLALP